MSRARPIRGCSPPSTRTKARPRRRRRTRLAGETPIMQVLILCGGRGTRLNGERPKPLMEIAGRPIVWHVVSIYAAQGFREFVLLTGFEGDVVANWAAGTEWPIE